MSDGKRSPPLFGADSDSDREEGGDLFASAVQSQQNNNEKDALIAAVDEELNSKSVEPHDAVTATLAATSKPTISTKPTPPPATATPPESSDGTKPEKSHDKVMENMSDISLGNSDALTAKKPSGKSLDRDAETAPLLADPLKGAEKPSQPAEPPRSEKTAEPPPKAALRSMEDFKPAEKEPVAQSKPAPAPRAQRHTPSEASEDGGAEGGDVSNKLTKETERDGKTASDEKDVEEERENSRNVIEILVTDPRKVGDGMNSYVVYKVTTRTNSRLFRSAEWSVTRRFSDFLGLHDKLLEMHQHRGKIVPPPPEKNVVGTTKVKMTKDETTGAQDFVEKRRAALERFLNRVARHPDLRGDAHFVEFLERDGDLPKATGTSALSGAGIARLFSKVGDSINKITYTMAEPDQWFEDKQEEIETFDTQMKDLHASLELLVLHRKDLAQNTGLLARSAALLGSAEEHMSLSKALSSLADLELKVEQLHSDQSDSDFFIFSELVKDYLNIIQTIKDVLHERVKLYKVWQDSDAALLKKREQKLKLEQQRKSDPQIDRDIAECEERVARFKDNFESISVSVRRELARFDRQRVKDFKATLLNYLHCMMNNQQQVATCWESFIPEARLIS